MAFTMSRGSPGTPPHTPGHGLPVFWHAVVPDYPFRAELAIRSRDISSRLCPLRGRYTSAPHGAREDYYGNSVTLGLAPRRRSHVRPCCTSERDLGAPLISLNIFTRYRSILRRLR